MNKRKNFYKVSRMKKRNLFKVLSAAFSLVMLFSGFTSVLAENKGIIMFDDNGNEGQDEKERVVQNKEEGFWTYESSSLTVHIKRHDEENVIFYMAEIITKDGELFRSVPSLDGSLKWPKTIAKENGTVFAVNSDFHHLRIKNKSKAGIIIRNGEIISDVTVAHNEGRFPNLDTMAVFPDGRLEVYPSDQYTAEEYIDMGALDVLAFGPYLIKDGIINQEGVEKYGKSRAPRTAIGMVEPGHYFAMMAEGRHKESKGVSIAFLAEKLLEQGCTTALNLDGGQTATMVFMGEQIITVGKTTSTNASARRATEIFGIGFSPLVVIEKE